MIKINYNGDKIEFPSEYTEVTMQDLDKMSNIFNKEAKEIDQWVQVISHLSKLKTKEIEEWPLEPFLKIISQMFIRIPKKEYPEYFDIDKRRFLTPKNASISVRDTAVIEKILEGKSNYKLTDICAYVMKEETTKTPLSLTQKTKLFKKQKTTVFLPFLLKFNMEYVGGMLDNLKALKNINEPVSISTNSSAQ